jgi:hypothetical protein
MWQENNESTRIIITHNTGNTKQAAALTAANFDWRNSMTANRIS